MIRVSLGKMEKHLQILPVVFNYVVMQQQTTLIPYKQTINDILGLSNAMVLCAINNEWERVEKLELERHSMMGLLSLPEKINEELTKTIQSIIDVNEQLINMGSTELNKRVSEVSKIKKSKKGIRAYENI